MTLTSFEQFKLLFKRIPKDRKKHVPFVLIRHNTKVPVNNWKDNQNWATYFDVKKYMGYGGNIAVVAIPKGLMFLDIDLGHEGVYIPNSVLNLIPLTFTVKTWSGGLHYYFINDGEWLNQKFVIDQGVLGKKEVGELRTTWQYIISCGSSIQEKTYRVLNDVPISKFEGDITKYFTKSPEIITEQEEVMHGKKAKPISEKHKKLMEEDRYNEKPEKRQAILAKLKERCYVRI